MLFSNKPKYVWAAVRQSIKSPCLPLSTFLSLSLSLRLRVDTILEDVQVVGGCYGNDILRWVPSHVQDFLGKVQAINAHISATTLTTSIHTPGPQHSPGLTAFSPGLQGYASPRLPVKHPEEAVVRSCHDHAGERRGEMGIVNAMQMVKRGKAKFRERAKGGKQNWMHRNWFDVCKACLWDWFKCRIMAEAEHLGNHCKQIHTDFAFNILFRVCLFLLFYLCHLPVWAVPNTLKLVEDAVVFIEGTQLTP